MVEPLFMISPIPAEAVGVAGGAMSAAIVALWRRGNVERDRREQERTADKVELIKLVERVVTALDQNTAAIQEANRA